MHFITSVIDNTQIKIQSIKMLYKQYIYYILRRLSLLFALYSENEWYQHIYILFKIQLTALRARADISP